MKNAELWEKIKVAPLEETSGDGWLLNLLANSRDGSYEFAHRAIIEYKKFLYLVSVYEEKLTPSIIVDQIWHCHLSRGRDYTSFCVKMFDKIISHEKNSDRNKEKTSAQYDKTIEFYFSEFGQPPFHYWPHRFSKRDNQEIIKIVFYSLGSIIMSLPLMAIGTASMFSGGWVGIIAGIPPIIAAAWLLSDRRGTGAREPENPSGCNGMTWNSEGDRDGGNDGTTSNSDGGGGDGGGNCGIANCSGCG